MVEGGAGPVRRRVAERAILREPRGLVGRVCRPVVVGLVAIPAGRAGQVGEGSAMATRAL